MYHDSRITLLILATWYLPFCDLTYYTLCLYWLTISVYSLGDNVDLYLCRPLTVIPICTYVCFACSAIIIVRCSPFFLSLSYLLLRYGALGCLGTPLVRSDAASVWATGKTWWQVPPVAKVKFTGSLPRGVTGKPNYIDPCTKSVGWPHSGKDVIVALSGL